MQTLLVFAGLSGLIWGIRKLGEPWRQYHKENIAPHEKELASAEALRTVKENARIQAFDKAELFSRDFQAEVRQHQRAKSEAYDELNPLRDRKSELHNEMDDVRSSLESWHRRSKSFFGNKRRKIKDDSILGWFGLEQTIAQKESLESRREAISSDIRNLKDEMSDIYESRIKPAKEGLKAVFDDQEHLRRLRQDGLNERYFRAVVKKLDSEITQIGIEVESLKAAIRNVTEAYKDQQKSRRS